MSISAALSTMAVSLSPMWKAAMVSYSFLNASIFMLVFSDLSKVVVECDVLAAKDGGGEGEGVLLHTVNNI